MHFLTASLHRTLAAALLLTLVAGCATQQGRRESAWPAGPAGTPPSGPVPHTPPMIPVPVPPVVPPAEGPATVPATPEALPPITVPTPAPNVPRSAEAISGQAVASLVKQARVQRAAGQPQQAQALLERAQRIEPRNYFVWSALAQSYLDQKNYDQAESVAQKSNSLARGNVYVELENWKTIRASRAARGDSSGAAQAEARVQALQQALGVY